jgi:hypothetical protein
MRGGDDDPLNSQNRTITKLPYHCPNHFKHQQWNPRFT